VPFYRVLHGKRVQELQQAGFLDSQPNPSFRPNRVNPEDCHGQGRHHQDQAHLQRRYRVLLRHQEELADDDRKLKMKKYDPIAKKHVEFVEGKIK
jgi:hypothetical protein